MCVCVCVCAFPFPCLYIYIYIYILIRELHKNDTSYIKSWKQMNGYLPPISTTTQKSRIRHVGHYWKSKDQLISIVPMDASVLTNQKEPAYNSSVCTQDVVSKTWLDRWMIGTNDHISTLLQTNYLSKQLTKTKELLRKGFFYAKLTFVLDKAQSHMNGALSETLIHSWRFLSLAC